MTASYVQIRDRPTNFEIATLSLLNFYKCNAKFLSERESQCHSGVYYVCYFFTLKELDRFRQQWRQFLSTFVPKITDPLGQQMKSWCSQCFIFPLKMSVFKILYIIIHFKTNKRQYQVSYSSISITFQSKSYHN